jgi:PmbA protein
MNMNNVRAAADLALRYLAQEGADKAQCVAGVTQTREFNMDGGEFSLFRTMFDKHLSLTAFKNAKRGVLAVNRFDDDAVKTAARECLAVAESGTADDAWDIAPGPAAREFTGGVTQPDMDRFFTRCLELAADIRARHPLVMVEQMVASHRQTDLAYASSNGVSYSVLEGEYRVDLMFSAHEGELGSSFFGSSVTTVSLDNPLISLASMEKDLADVEKQIRTVPVAGKFTGTILLPPGCLGELLASMLDNFASDRPVLDGTSLWKNALGTQVADSRITLSMAPLDPRIVSGEHFTGEGFVSENYDVIRNGVLASFQLSLYVANKTGHPRAGNASRSMILKPGDTSLADMISGIKRGLVVGRFSGGAPGTNGDFCGVAKNSFLIEDGKITHAVSETMINGNLADMLKNLVAISQETVSDGSSVLPYAAFDNIVISGK